MDGNYEFVRQVARDKQSALAREAGQHRLAKQARLTGGQKSVLTVATTIVNRLVDAVQWVARRGVGHAVGWKSLRHRFGVVTR